jgi:hypothetical protein
LNGIFRGTEIYQRVGEQVNLKSLEIDIKVECLRSLDRAILRQRAGNIETPVLGPNRGVRVVIVFIKGLDGTRYDLSHISDASTLFGNDTVSTEGIKKTFTFYSKINSEYRGKVIPLYDVVHNAGTRYTNFANANQIQKLEDLAVLYDMQSPIRGNGNFYIHTIIDLNGLPVTFDTELSNMGNQLQPHAAISDGIIACYLFTDFSLEMPHYAREWMAGHFQSKVTFSD